ncbi:MAG: glycosyltransferase family 4 protein [Anaerolineae bacterium]|nr:glycosyltransferase family 4 protein [Anaerolineae bacterium]
MRVAFLTQQATSADGWGRYSVEVVRHLHALGVMPVLLTAFPDKDPALAALEHHVVLPPAFGGRLAGLRGLRKAPALRRALQGCDVMHCLVERYAPLAALARPADMPCLLTAHGTWAVRPLEHRVSRVLYGWAFRQANPLIVQSRFTLAQMQRHLALPHAEVLSGGIDPARFAAPAELALPGWAQQGQVIFSAGAIKTRKGYHVLLEAFARVAQQLPAAHWVVAGGEGGQAGYAERLRARIATLGLVSRVHLLGQVSEAELLAWYQRADVFALLPANDGSSFEGLGLVYLEAGASGVPSVGALDCGAVDAIREGETGFLVPQNNPQAAAEALLRLLHDPSLRARMGHAARQFAASLTWARLAQALLRRYEAALAP